MIKILTVLGARPQFIKSGSLSRLIDESDRFTEVIIHTGQHYDHNMSDVFFEDMSLSKPKYQLGISGKSHGAMTGQMTESIEEIIFKESPDVLLVYGDTNSTLAGALAASKLQVPIAHVEAGLRSHNMAMPEEVNRILTDRVSKFLFCPTLSAKENLSKEGFDDFDCKVVLSGDVMLDIALFYQEKAKPPQENIEEDFILSTIHRAENTNSKIKMKGIFKALNEISSEKKVVIPIHPRTKKLLSSLELDLGNIAFIEPQGYFEMLWLIKNSSLIMTDSGGLQKEAFFFRKPCITLRDETEWVELVDNRFNVLAGACRDKIINLYDSFDFNNNMGVNLYGDGCASNVLLQTLTDS